jgi:hypothetical protein
MAEVLKVLAQQSPPASALTDAYVVPGATSATCSSLTICNRNNADVTVSVSVAVGGAADADEQYLYSDLPLTAHNTFIATVGLTLAASDVIRVKASSTAVAFQFFGVEVS